MSDHWVENEGGRRDRAARVLLLNRVLGHWGLSVGDWAGSVYTLSDGKGRSIVVTDVGMVWSSAEKLVGAPLDPLDPGLLDALERHA